MIKSVAIFGAKNQHASAIAEVLALDASFQIILVANNQKELIGLRDKIVTINPSVDIELSDCASDASWRADIIILALCSDLQKLISGSIEGFVTQKTIIVFVKSEKDVFDSSRVNELQILLPNTHIVSVYFEDNLASEKTYYASGSNSEALEEAIDLLQSAGFNQAKSKNQIINN